MVGIFGDQDLGDGGLGRQPTFDEPCRRRRLQNTSSRRTDSVIALCSVSILSPTVKTRPQTRRSAHHPEGESGTSLTIRLAPRKQKLIGNPVPTRHRRGQPWARQTLLDDANLRLIRPSTAPTRVNNLKTTDRTTVSKAIHTDSQLHLAQFGKAAYAG